MWLSGLSASLRTEELLVRFLVRAHALVVGRVPSGGHTTGNHTLMFLFVSFSLLSPVSKNKSKKNLLKQKPPASMEMSTFGTVKMKMCVSIYIFHIYIKVKENLQYGQ